MKGLRKIRILLWILLGIILFFILLLSFRVSVRIKYTDRLEIKLKYGPIPLNGILKKIVSENKKPKEKKPPTGKNNKSDVGEKKGITEIIEEVTAAVNKFSSCFFKRLRIKVANVIITVGTNNPAKTAVLFGTVVQAVAILVDALKDNTDFKTSKNTQIRVDPDFANTKSTVKIDICLSVTVFHVLVSGIKTLLEYITVSNKHKSNQQTVTDGKQKGLV